MRSLFQPVVLVLLAAVAAQAQPTLTQSDIQNAFYNQKRLNVYTEYSPGTMFNPGTSGNASEQTFDFSDMTNATSRDTQHQTFVPPAGQPGASNFPDADIALPVVLSPIPGATITAVQYWQLEADGLYLLGQYVHQFYPPFVDTAYVSVIYPREMLVPLPITYGTTRTTRDTIYEDQEANDFIVSDRMFYCDAWGDITFPPAAMPGGMPKTSLISSLRMRTTVTESYYFGGVLSGSGQDMNVLFLAVDGTYLDVEVTDNAYVSGETEVSDLTHGYSVGTTEVREAGPGIPEGYTLGQNYPNPFNPTTSVRFGVPEAVHVTLKVYDQLGREIAVLVDEQLQPGSYDAPFDASNLSSGIYVYRLTAGGFTASGKMSLIR
jgi:hypothetical protein